MSCFALSSVWKGGEWGSSSGRLVDPGVTMTMMMMKNTPQHQHSWTAVVHHNTSTSKILYTEQVYLVLQVLQPPGWCQSTSDSLSSDWHDCVFPHYLWHFCNVTFNFTGICGAFRGGRKLDWGWRGGGGVGGAHPGVWITPPLWHLRCRNTEVHSG